MAIVCLLFKCKFDWDFNFYLVFWLSFNQFGFEIDLRIDQIPSLSTEFIWTKEKEINSITLLFQCMISIRNFKQSSKMMALSHASSYHGWKVICWFWNRFVWCLDSRIFFCVLIICWAGVRTLVTFMLIEVRKCLAKTENAVQKKKKSNINKHTAHR